MRKISSGLWGGVVLLGALWSTVASAEQVVVMDQTWVHGPDIPDSHFTIDPMEGTPANWVSPVDYSKGSAWVYLEVHSKPTRQETKFQVCFGATPTYACTEQSPTYTSVGTVEWESPFQYFYQGDMVDWSQGIKGISAILKDTMNNKPSADNVGDEVAALYMPTEVRMVVTLVAPGSMYEPPTPTGEGTTGGEASTGDGSTGGDDDSGDVGTSGDTSTGAASTGDTSPSETGQPHPETTGPAPTTGDGETGGETGELPGSGTTGDTTGGSSSGGEQDVKSDGCSCVATSGDGPAGALLVTCVALALGRRRRARQA